MKVVKNQRLALLTKVLEDRGEATLVVSAIAFFPFDPAGALGAEIAMWKLAAAELGKDTPLDLAMPKPRGEVLLTAKAYPLGRTPRPACSVRVRLGSVDKTLWVAGDREWKRGGPTEPAPFTEMPITWARAFGGADYPQNPLGVGLAPDPETLRHPLPNIEDPRSLVGSPSDRPAPAGFGPIDLTWPQRFAKIGTYDAKWLEERYPGFAADFDASFFNTAPLDQQIEGFFRGDEAFTLENLHPDKPTLEGRLPGVRARVLVNLDPASIALRDVPMRAETVHLFPHVERGIVIFRGTCKVAEDDASDVRELVAAFEALDEPKPLEHYQTVLAQRLDRKKGHLYTLRDRDLLPSALPPAPAVPGDSEVKDALADEGYLGAHLRRRTERELAAATERANEMLKAEGRDPLPAPPALPPPFKAPPIDELPALAEQLEAQLEQGIADAEKHMAEAIENARQECLKQGVDYDKMVAENQAKSGGPPKFSAAEEMENLRAQVELARNAEIALPELEAQLADPEIMAKLEKVEAMLKDTYRLFAHYMPGGAALDAEVAKEARARFVAARDAGESFRDRDFTGADLSGLDLRGLDLRLAFLEGVSLEGSDLRGADLTAAVLARANLTGALLAGAKLPLANLGGARLVRADAAGADLSRAVLAKADLSEASLRGAVLEGADLGGATFRDTDLGEAVAPQLTLLKSDLAGVSLRGAKLSRAVFFETSIAGVDFSGADLSDSIMMTVRADGAVFRGADLTRLQVVQDCSFAGAVFAKANLTGAQLRGLALAGADLSHARLEGANLAESDLSGATLERAVAVGALFGKANLKGANLRGADLMEAILERAKLRGADLENANLFRADMLKVDVDRGTITRGANLKGIRFVKAGRPHGSD